MKSTEQKHKLEKSGAQKSRAQQDFERAAARAGKGRDSAYPWYPAYGIFCRETPPEQLASDKRRIARFLRHPPDVPVLKDALAWAQAHGVKIMIDHNLKGAGAYYPLGSGVVVLPTHLFMRGNKAALAASATHELRHAWQDFHGLLGSQASSPARAMMAIALVEADARAFEKLARDQYYFSRYGVQHDRAAEMGMLRDGFRKWFDSYSSSFYASRHGEIMARCFNVPAAKGDSVKASYRLQSPVRPCIDPDDRTALEKLGRGFDGGTRNYLLPLLKDFVPRTVLSGDQALRGYKEGGKPYAFLKETEIRQRLLRAAGRTVPAHPFGV